MPPIEIVLIIIAVALCILMLVLIPTLLTIKRSAASVGELADMIQSELKPTLQEITGVLAEFKTIGNGMTEYNDDVRRLMSELGEAGKNLHTINRTVGVVTGVIDKTSVWATGARVAGKYLFERYLKKQGGI